MENKTAVEWLKEQLLFKHKYKYKSKMILKNLSGEEVNNLINQALELEKQQIIDAFLVGDIETVYDEKDAEQYYSKTYKKTTE